MKPLHYLPAKQRANLSHQSGAALPLLLPGPQVLCASAVLSDAEGGRI